MSTCLRDRPDPATKEYEHTYHRVAQLNRHECPAYATPNRQRRKGKASPSHLPTTTTQYQRQAGKKYPVKFPSLSQPNHPRCTTTTPKRPCLRSARSGAAKNNLGRARRSRLPLGQRKGRFGFTHALDLAWARRGQRKSGSSPQSTQVSRDRCFFAFSGSLLERTTWNRWVSLERLRPPSHVARSARDSSSGAPRCCTSATQRSAATTTCMNRFALRVKPQQQEKLRLVFPDVALIALFRCFSF